MKMMLILMFSLAAGVSLGAYQYIISTNTELAVNLSVSAYSSAVSVNARTAATGALGTPFESRYRTSTESNTSALNRLLWLPRDLPIRGVKTVATVAEVGGWFVPVRR